VSKQELEKAIADAERRLDNLDASAAREKDSKALAKIDAERAAQRLVLAGLYGDLRAIEDPA
jgi:hypothetical protein